MTENQVEISPFILKRTAVAYVQFQYANKEFRVVAIHAENPDYFLFMLQCEEFEDYKELDLSKGICFSKVKILYNLDEDKITFITPVEY